MRTIAVLFLAAIFSFSFTATSAPIFEGDTAYVDFSRDQGKELSSVEKADELLAAYEYKVGFDKRFGNSDRFFKFLREKLTCFVENIKLPSKVYVECAVGIVDTAITCSAEGVSPACLVDVSQSSRACVEPIGDLGAAVEVCANADNQGSIDYD